VHRIAPASAVSSRSGAPHRPAPRPAGGGEQAPPPHRAGHLGRPAQPSPGPRRARGLVASDAAVTRGIRRASPEVIAVAGIALIVLLLLPGFLVPLIRPRPRGS
jgi:hypothetical protein